MITERTQVSIDSVDISRFPYWSDMSSWVGVAAGVLCALFVIVLLYAFILQRRRRSSSKVRRSLHLPQPGDPALHRSVLPWTTEVPSPVYLAAPRASLAYPQLIGSRPRNASIDYSENRNLGITLKAEVLDSTFYESTIKKKTRMNGELAQAIAAFGIGSFGRSEVKEDKLDLTSNMEVVYQERTAV